MQMRFFVFENQVNYEIINYYPLLYKVVIEYKLQKNTMRQQVMFSSPVLRGSYRILSEQMGYKTLVSSRPLFSGVVIEFNYLKNNPDLAEGSRPLFSGVVIELDSL